MHLIALTFLTLAFAKTDASAYKGKFYYTVRGQTVAACKKIDDTQLKELNTYKGCSERTYYTVPFEDVEASCEKANDTTAFIFATEEQCKESFAENKSGTT